MNMNIMQLLQHNRKTHHVFLLIILVLSAYVHLWNPVGFPDINFDEGIYMRRAMNTLETGNPQESYFYDHPYFGQIILAGVLKIAGFPQSVEQSLELSYLILRLCCNNCIIFMFIIIYNRVYPCEIYPRIKKYACNNTNFCKMKNDFGTTHKKHVKCYKFYFIWSGFINEKLHHSK